MDIVELVRTRYTTKHYDSARRISDRDIADLMEVLRLSPSSVNSQPWHFFVTGTDEGKARVMPAVLDFNRPRVADASHLVVFAVPVEFTEALPPPRRSGARRRPRDGRGCGFGCRRCGTPPLRGASGHAGGAPFLGDAPGHIAMGFLLWAAAERGIDSTCLEGLDMAKMDECLGLAEKGLRTVCAVSLGYRLPDDSNAARPKSRLPMDEVVTVF
ncbi:MAG: nitroreductase family protein [Sutterella wadsworthensis]